MNILALDTSSEVASVAILNEDKLIIDCTMNYKKSHSEKIMPMIDSIMRFVDMKPEDIDVIAVALGPGSFTGLRIGLATAKALCQALDKKIVGVPSLRAAAYNLPYSQNLICSVVNALRGEVFGAIYKWDGDRLIEVEEPALMKIEEFIEVANNYEGYKVLVNDGSKLFDVESSNWIKPHGAIGLPKAVSVGMAALERVKNNDFDDINTIIPIYMRKSAAEEQYEKVKNT